METTMHFIGGCILGGLVSFLLDRAGYPLLSPWRWLHTALLIVGTCLILWGR